MQGNLDVEALEQEIVTFLGRLPPPPAKWRPTLGQETVDVLEGLHRAGLSRSEVATVCNESFAILSRCAPPVGAPGRATGIAIGRVQSGKTTSFTALAALAADNGFAMVVVLAGTSTALFEQSEGRFVKSLRLDSRGPLAQRWVRFSNPDLADADHIRAELQKWSNPKVPSDERRVVLLMVMKNHARIRNLNRLLNDLASELSSTPAIVVDDEADQAGLNTQVKKDGESTTYSRILGLRRALPWHSYIQYTATPQAPLLISIIDMLSPEFPVVLTPGEAYTGGDRFFGPAALDLVRPIPASDLVRAEDEVSPPPPSSLLEALRVFFVGVAAGRIVYKHKRQGPDNRSMMVHPSQRVDPHGQFADWIRRAKRQWADELADPARQGEAAKDFERAWVDLGKTVDDLPAFDEILETLSRRIDETVVLQMNAREGKTPTPDWKNNYAYILVGGQAMDRGFTVEGLTVTYMPRPKGTGNADTIQQRARFFGYKRDYLGYCRVYLEPETSDLLKAYVEHENDIHGRMREVMEKGASLKEWKRAFILHRDLRATRDAVLRDPTMRENFAGSWWYPKAPHDSEGAVAENTETLATFLKDRPHRLFRGDDQWNDDQTPYLYEGLPLRTVLEGLMSRWALPRAEDSIKFTALQLQLKRALDRIADQKLPEPMCDIFVMSQGGTRKRTLNSESNEIPTLFQGSNANTNYPGDSEVKTPGRTTVQLHWLRLVDDQGFARDRVPALAVFLPATPEFSVDVLTQRQG